jgi:1-acyl-sn-glycerol-3-phosphate acyltransferase
MLGVAWWIMLGAAAGSLLAGVQGHPRRSLGLVPLALTGLLATLLWTAAAGTPGWGLCVLVGVLGGLIKVPLSSAYQESVPADARGNGMAVLNTAGNLLMATMAALVAVLARTQVVSSAGQLWLVAGLTALGAGIGWRTLYRDSLELVLEIVLWPVYRVRAVGPGVDSLPRRGPLIVVANHSSWFDPLWLAKVLPRQVTPMMTSIFYDLPVMRWLMVHVVHAIRVQHSTYRREAPELQEAIAALDRGACVLVFPEGMLRRRADLVLRQFGQGVWHILRDRPHTPVVVCWIEGGWGSYMSYCGGPPLVNKRPDWWRRIRIAVTAPQVLDPVVLADDRTTRSHLMEVCLDARRFLGLEPLSMSELSSLGRDEVPSELGGARSPEARS